MKKAIIYSVVMGALSTLAMALGTYLRQVSELASANETSPQGSEWIVVFLTMSLLFLGASAIYNIFKGDKKCNSEEDEPYEGDYPHK